MAVVARRQRVIREHLPGLVARVEPPIGYFAGLVRRRVGEHVIASGRDPVEAAHGWGRKGVPRVVGRAVAQGLPVGVASLLDTGEDVDVTADDRRSLGVDADGGGRDLPPRTGGDVERCAVAKRRILGAFGRVLAQEVRAADE